MSTCSWRRFFFSASMSSHACTDHVSTLSHDRNAGQVHANHSRVQLTHHIQQALVSFTISHCTCDSTKSSGRKGEVRGTWSKVTSAHAGAEQNAVTRKVPVNAEWQSPGPECRQALSQQCPCGSPCAPQTPLPIVPCVAELILTRCRDFKAMAESLVLDASGIVAAMSFRCSLRSRRGISDLRQHAMHNKRVLLICKILKLKL